MRGNTVTESELLTLWQAVLGEIELTIPSASFMTWFKNTQLCAQREDGTVEISVSNIFAKNQLEVKFDDLISKTLRKNGVPVKKVIYTITSQSKKKTAQEPVMRPKVEAIQGRAKADSPSSQLNPRYTFDNFIVGSSNELAYTACQSISKNPGTKYNPLFLYGGVGLGKTHLIQAVGNEIAKRNPASQILYSSSETFMNEFLDSIRYKTKGFSERYRKVDVLIIDDIQFIAGKQATQEGFFHTFNALHQANKQIIITSDKPPKNIPTLEERLRSRFEWGMAIDIQMPDYETRCAILQEKAGASGVDLNRETVEYLATNIKTNIRELEGALNQLLAYAEMRGIEPDIHTASALISNASRSRPHHVTPRQVVLKTASHFQIDSKEILSPRRDKFIVVPRQIAMYLLRSELHLSFPKIAHELGRKDHTTAIHSVEKIEKAIKLDYLIRQQVSEIRERLYA